MPGDPDIRRAVIDRDLEVRVAENDPVLDVHERVGRRVVSVSATGHGRTVTVGSAARNLSSGQSRLVTLKLNSTGKRLLARFRHMKIRVLVTQLTAKGSSKAVAHQTLTLKAPRRI